MSGCGSYRPGLPLNIPPRSLEGGTAARSCSDSPHPPVLHARPEIHDNPAECAHTPRAGRLSSIDRSRSDDTPDAERRHRGGTSQRTALHAPPERQVAMSCAAL